MQWVLADPGLVVGVAAAVLEQAGLEASAAATVAAVQLAADRRGMHSHGVRAIPMYAERLQQGIINRRPSITVTPRGRAAVVVHGDDGPGQVVASRAMAECIRLAKATGFGVTTAHRSNHLGAVGYYTAMAAEADLIGFATTNGNVMLPPPGAAPVPVVGNNPLAWAFPAGEEADLVFDVATSVVAGGKIDLAAAEGDAIPAGWGIDAAGLPTLDATRAAEGGLALALGAPAAPHKGFGLALVLEVLAGVLSGARFGRQHGVEVEPGPEPWDEGHFFLAFDPELLMPIAEFKARLDNLIRDVAAVAPGPDGRRARLPGGQAAARAAWSRANGVLPLPASVYARLQRAVAAAGLTPLPALPSVSVGWPDFPHAAGGAD